MGDLTSVMNLVDYRQHTEVVDMAATRQEIQSWFDAGVKKEATHLIVKCDTFDMADGDCCYPVYVDSSEDVRAVERKNKDRTMEVYVLDTARRDEQVGSSKRVFNFE